LNEGARYCASCGQPFVAKPAATAPPPQAAQVRKGEPIVPPQAPPRTQKPAQATQPVRRTVVPPPPPPRISKCPNCSKDVTPNTKYCPNCGFNMEAAIKRMSTQRGAAAPRDLYFGEKRKFFSFEGYQLEGVGNLAILLIVWGVWDVAAAILSLISQTGGRIVVLWLPGGLDSATSIFPTVVFLALGVVLIMVAFGLLLVKPPFFWIGIATALVLVPLSLFQIIHGLTGEFPTSPTGTHQMDNIMMGLVGLMVAAVTLLQFLRTKKYFTGGET